MDVSSITKWERFQENYNFENINICNLLSVSNNDQIGSTTVTTVAAEETEPEAEVDPEARIGSLSVEAEVYKVKLYNKYFAIKIMPLINFNSFNKNKNEILIASMVSSSSSGYFPKVYLNKLCEVYLNARTSNFYKTANLFAYADYISQSIPNDYLKRFISLFKLNKFQTIDDYYIYLESIGYKNIDLSNIHSSAHVMISELAWGDLLTYISIYYKEIDYLMIINIIRQVEQALYELHYTFHVKHNDLHTGNILIKGDLTQPTLMIHDFGKSEIYSNVVNTRSYFEQDFTHFLTKLIETFENFDMNKANYIKNLYKYLL